MCLSAIYWAVYYSASKECAAEVNFDDDFICQEIKIPNEQKSIKMTRLLEESGKSLLKHGN